MTSSKYFIALLSLLLTAMSGAHAAGKGTQTLPQANYQHLPGHWLYERDLPNVRLYGVISYEKGGSGHTNQMVVLNVGDFPLTFMISVKEKWERKGNVIVSTVKSGTIKMNEEERRTVIKLYGKDPEELFIHVGKQEHIEIEKLNQDQLTVVLHKNKEGKTPIAIHAQRVDSDNPADYAGLPSLTAKGAM